MNVPQAGPAGLHPFHMGNPPCGMEVIALTALRPESSPSQSASLLLPRGQINPIPVITTLRCTELMAIYQFPFSTGCQESPSLTNRPRGVEAHPNRNYSTISPYNPALPWLTYLAFISSMTDLNIAYIKQNNSHNYV